MSSRIMIISIVTLVCLFLLFIYPTPYGYDPSSHGYIVARVMRHLWTLIEILLKTL